MAAVLKYWREAATLVLVSAKRGRGSIKFSPTISKQPEIPKGDNFDVLMLKRSSKSTFMPNLYVFPGGIASDADFSEEWLELFGEAGENGKSKLFKFLRGQGEGPQMFSRVRDAQFSTVPSELAFRICAIRETFEESGVLLARKISDLNRISLNEQSAMNGNAIVLGENMDQWRRKIEANAEEFISMCKVLKIVPDVWSLYEWSNWLTPAQEIVLHRKPRRYDTAFFICCVEEKPDVMEDKGETVHSQWGTPSNILSEYENGWAGLAPPQMYELARLLNFGSMSDLRTFLASRASERVLCFFPIRFNCADAVLMLMPGDGLYPEQPDWYGEGAVLSSDLTLEELNKKYPRMHRTVFVNTKEGKRKASIACNIDVGAKHIAPLTDYSMLLPPASEQPDSKL